MAEWLAGDYFGFGSTNICIYYTQMCLDVYRGGCWALEGWGWSFGHEPGMCRDLVFTDCHQGEGLCSDEVLSWVGSAFVSLRKADVFRGRRVSPGDGRSRGQGRTVRCQEAVHPPHLLSCWDFTGSRLSLPPPCTMATGVALAGTWDQMVWGENDKDNATVALQPWQLLALSRSLPGALDGSLENWEDDIFEGKSTPQDTPPWVGAGAQHCVSPAPRSAVCYCNPSPPGCLLELTQGAAGVCVCVYLCVPE